LPEGGFTRNRNLPHRKPVLLAAEVGPVLETENKEFKPWRSTGGILVVEVWVKIVGRAASRVYQID
jgi:hypothetical protein